MPRPNLLEKNTEDKACLVPTKTAFLKITVRFFRHPLDLIRRCVAKRHGVFSAFERLLQPPLKARTRDGTVILLHEDVLLEGQTRVTAILDDGGELQRCAQRAVV